MAKNINITPNRNENVAQLLRRFTNVFREMGIMPAVKGRRYYSRPDSERVEKNTKLRRIQDSQKHRALRRLGKTS